MSFVAHPAHQLFSPQRLDLIVKLLFFRALKDGTRRADAEALYRKHIAQRTGGIEPPNYDGTPQSKQSVDDYVRDAQNLLGSMQTRGYDPAFPAPIGSNGLLLNAAHRIACAACLGHDVPVSPEAAPGHAWDFRWFQEHGFTKDELSLILKEYAVATADRTIVFVLWGPVLAYWDALAAQIAAQCQIVGSLDFAFGNWEAAGFRSLVHDIYAYDIHDYAHGMAHIDKKLEFLEAAPRFYRVIVASVPPAQQDETADLARTLKDKLRTATSAKVDADKFITCHTSDSPGETRHLAATLLDPFNLAAVRQRPAPVRPEFLRWLSAYGFELQQRGIDRDACCIVGSAGLEIAGIRLATDIDFTVRKSLRERLFNQDPAALTPDLDIVSEGYHRVRNGDVFTDDRLIDDAGLHVLFRGYKCATVDIIRDRKAFSARAKDLLDVELIDRFRSLTPEKKTA